MSGLLIYSVSVVDVHLRCLLELLRFEERYETKQYCKYNSNRHCCLFPQHCKAQEKAQVEIRRLRIERERYEESMKKAFMRGVCALNMEALSMFQSTEGRPEQPPLHEQHGL